MPDNLQVKSNAVSNQFPDNVDEVKWGLKFFDNQEGGGVAQSTLYPHRPGEPDCLFYLRTGLCGYGSNCRFNHPAYAAQGAHREELPERVGQPDCGYYLKTGTCKYGSTCKYHHPKDKNGARPVSFNLLGLPMRQDEKSCPYYMRTGSCKFGVACKFHHPQPSSVGTGLPVTGAASFGSMGSSILPLSGLPFASSLPTWSLPRSPYLSGPHLLGSQAYMPFVMSPSQGLVPVPGWNTYMGNIGPVSPSGIAGSNLIYYSRNQGEFGAGGQVQMLAPPTPNLPERPDQPDCRYYMNTGTCKYGTDCKFHHPKEKIAQSASNVGPLGIPSGPGQAVCSNYSMYGICKFGPACRFDHPYAGYPFNYSLSRPVISILDSSLMTRQGMPTTHSSGTSPVMSSKIPNSVQNSDAESTKCQNPATKNADDSSEVDHSSPQSMQNSSDCSLNPSI